VPLGAEAVFCPACGTRQKRQDGRPGEGGAGLTAGWHEDPFRRAEYRLFDGEIWTDRVYSGGYGRDVVSVDHLGDEKIPEGVWRASFGSLALSLGGLVLSFALSLLFLLPLIVTHHHNTLLRLVVSETGLWSGLYATCLVSSRRYGTGKIGADFRWRFKWQDLWIALIAAIVARCVAVIVLVPFIHEVRKAGNPDKSLYAITSLGGWGWLVLVVFSCVGAPLFEELFFRGLLQGQLVERTGVGIGIVSTAVVFGTVHIANDPGVAGLLLALTVGAGGIVLGVVRHLTGRLGTSTLAHSLFNAIALIVLAAVGSR
jgi:membrane protease YdiL (CAAX protease family)